MGGGTQADADMAKNTIDMLAVFGKRHVQHSDTQVVFLLRQGGRLSQNRATCFDYSAATDKDALRNFGTRCAFGDGLAGDLAIKAGHGRAHQLHHQVLQAVAIIERAEDTYFRQIALEFHRADITPFCQPLAAGLGFEVGQYTVNMRAFRTLALSIIETKPVKILIEPLQRQSAI